MLPICIFLSPECINMRERTVPKYTNWKIIKIKKLSSSSSLSFVFNTLKGDHLQRDKKYICKQHVDSKKNIFMMTVC